MTGAASLMLKQQVIEWQLHYNKMYDFLYDFCIFLAYSLRGCKITTLEK